MSMPLVSILIPVYNREKFIQETMDSALNQTYENIEIIAVDNKSTDKTYEILKKYAEEYKNIRIYQNEKNLGPVRNWRKCLEYAKGEYVKFLFLEDLIDETFIEKTLPYLVNYEDVGFVFTRTEFFFSYKSERKVVYSIGETGLYDANIFVKNSLLGNILLPVSPSCALFRRRDVEKNLLIDIPNKLGIDFKIHGAGNDALIFLLTARDYPRFAFINETLSVFRCFGDNITSLISEKWEAIYRCTAHAYFVEKYLNDISLKKKFNSKLFAIYLKNIYTRKLNPTLLKILIEDIKVKDIDHLYLIRLLMASVIRRLKTLG